MVRNSAISANEDIDANLHSARAAATAGKLDLALSIYADLRKSVPGLAAAYLEAAAILSRARRYQESELILTDAMGGFPNNSHVMIEYALASSHQRHWSEAVTRWNQVRLKLSARWEGYFYGVMALREHGDFAAAEELVLTAMERFPQDFRLRHEYALVAHSRRDWPEAVRRFILMQDKFPNRPEGFCGAANAYGRNGDHAEARRILDAAAIRFPNDRQLATDRIWDAISRKDWKEAASLADGFGGRFAQTGETYGLAVLAYRRNGQMDKAEAVGRAGMTAFPEHGFLAAQYAWCAVQRLDWNEAHRRWINALSIAPNDRAVLNGIAETRQAIVTGLADTSTTETSPLREPIVTHLERVNVFRRNRDIGGAAKCINEALTQYPNSPELRKLHAMIATDGGDHAAAALRWRAHLAFYPDSAESYVRCCSALRLSKQTDEAEILASEALRTFPHDFELHLEYALAAVAARDHVKAVVRCSTLRARFPQRVEGYYLGAHSCRASGDYREAERLATLAYTRFPQDPQGWVQIAWVWHDQREWVEAARRWTHIRQRFPGNLESYLFGALAYSRAGNLESADRILREAVGRFPDSLQVAIDFAKHATDRRDWDEALRRWRAALAAFPDSSIVEAGAKNAAYHLQLTSCDENRAGDVFGAKGTSDLRRLMMSFEGLGDNCEFGLVQRKYGAEPIGLLRWASIGAKRLALAIREGFPEIGEPDNTKLNVHENGEYFLVDVRNGFDMHTFVKAKEHDAEKELRLHRRRLRFLRDKLFQDLAGAEKIFVYKPRSGVISEVDLNGLRDAIRLYGESVLLCVQVETPAKPDRLVELVDNGLLMGYISRVSPGAKASEIDFESWLAICQRAMSLVADRKTTH